MADQIVITEKTSQAKDVRAAIGSRYGDVLPAEGHLFDLLEPEDVVPAWKRWSPILLRPEGLYGTRPAEGGNKAAKLKAIREALRTAKRVWLATDCDREGQLIGQEILEHYEYRGQVMRVLFTAQDSQTIRDAFDGAKPNTEYSRLYAAAVARRQADQIYNLSLTRTATVILGRDPRRVIGVGRVNSSESGSRIGAQSNCIHYKPGSPQGCPEDFRNPSLIFDNQHAHALPDLT
jgi:DNA topoisomerase-3